MVSGAAQGAKAYAAIIAVVSIFKTKLHLVSNVY
jgi:hypothetical protein